MSKISWEEIQSGELIVMLNLNNQLTVVAPPKAEEIQLKQAFDMLNNGFNTLSR